MTFFSNFYCQTEDLSIGRVLSEKKKLVLRGYFLKKQKLSVQNLTKERKPPPVVILQQAIFYNIFIPCLWIRIISRSNQGVQFMNFISQILFDHINLGFRAAILKKFIWLWLLNSSMKRCPERCAMQLYSTSLSNT